jgi:hypothetical protein
MTEHLTENEAASLAGVTIATLYRFAEAGYLQTLPADDGAKRFVRSEIRTLFGISEPISKRRVAASDTATDSQVQTPPTPKTNATVVSIRPAAEQVVSNESEQLTELEIAQLKNVIELQEKLLDARDKELTDLRQQREWLQARIEKLEDKAERDQLLLLSETQMVRQLILQQQVGRKRSTLRLALDWLGITPNAEEEAKASEGATVEFPRAHQPTAQTVETAQEAIQQSAPRKMASGE